MELRVVDLFGRTAIASRDFAFAERVVGEEPLLRTLDTDLDEGIRKLAEDLAYEHHGFLQILQFVKASPDVQARVLDCYHPVVAEMNADDPLFHRTKKIAEACRQHFAECKMHSLETLQAVQMVFDMNAHHVGTGIALFEWCSKLSHSCSPNTVFRFVDGRGSQYALRAIKTGEVLTSDYLGFDSLQSTAVRQKLLQRSKRFTCRCTRCEDEPDTCRAMPCPECSAEWRREDLSLFPGGETEYGYVTCHTKRVASGQREDWVCSKCKKVFNEEHSVFKEVLQYESKICASSEAAILALKGKGAGHLSDLTALARTAAGLLGKKHYTVHRLGYYITVLAVAQVQEDYKNTPPRTPEDSVIWTIVQHCDQLWSWAQDIVNSPAVYVGHVMLGASQALVYPVINCTSANDPAAQFALAAALPFAQRQAAIRFFQRALPASAVFYDLDHAETLAITRALVALTSGQPELGDCSGLPPPDGDRLLSGLVICGYCGKLGSKDDIKACARCRRTFYCTRECQVAAWKAGHKSACTAAQT